MRQKQTVNNSSEQIQRQHEEVKASSVSSGFPEVNYQQQQRHIQQQQQQQKYNQQNNEAQWRSRNCKSNYTAEALIGTNNTDNNSHADKNLPKYSSAANYGQNKFSTSLSSDPLSINYFPNVDEAAAAANTGYGQVMNQNFNHSYAYSSNAANIYPTSNFISNISNSSTNYMMSLHENSTTTADYLESNNFLLPTSSITTPLLSNMTTDGAKNHHHHPPHHHHHHQPYTPSKHQNNCDKRPYFGQQKKSKKKMDSGSGSSSSSTAVQNFDFPISGITSPLDDYHHASTFLPPPNPLYQNQANVYGKSALPPPPPPPPPPVSTAAVVSTSALPSAVTVSSSQGIVTSSNPMAMTQHHPSGTSLTNFNLSTIFPEINDKVAMTCHLYFRTLTYRTAGYLTMMIGDKCKVFY